ncbi:MAG: sugar transferase [Planctomycetota bacterium]|jgi:lipopolysaccharide/colanic/teichoic acid biosynthesis glycosyltransferase|nr:sugar transferase [Planctomycetota bacterium]
MFLTTVRGGGGVLARLSGAKDLEAIVPVESLRRSITRERYRADRTRRPLSVALFDTALATPQEVRHLAQRLDDRRRLTDDLGWLDTRHIAALLPDTPATGAERFVSDILASLGGEAELFSVEILAHPWQSDDDDDRASRCSVLGDSQGNVTDRHRHPKATPPTQAQATVSSLEPFFLQPLPLWKRAMDIAGSLFLLVLLAPLFLLVAAAIKLDSPGKVFFHQPRAGRGGRPFNFHKFRSMCAGAEARKRELDAQNEADGPIFKIREDPRITRVGHFIRRTSIDELPQLWNVLMGEMSLVGPRPPTLNEIPAYEPWQARRLEQLGGLTCIWQVSGRSEIGFTDWMRMDLRYARQRSLLTDLRLLFQTIGAVVTRKGAY